MKKRLFIITLLLLTLASTGCIFKRDDLEDITIYTTAYPIKYLTDKLYGYNSDVKSIYPNGIMPNNYKLKEKQYNNYSEASIFIYNGQSDEKKVAAEFINRNKDMKIIDATQGILTTETMSDLWLSPSNYLMMAQNIKNRLKEYISNKYIKEEIDANYEELKINISEIDAELKIIAENAENKTIVVSDNSFNFLKKYGFDIIILNEDISSSDATKIKNMFSNKKLSFIYVIDSSEATKMMTEYINNYEITLKSINSISMITDDEAREGEDFITIMKKNVETIKEELF